MRFSRQEYWSGSPFTSPGHLLNPGFEPGSAALRAILYPEPPRKPKKVKGHIKNLNRKPFKLKMQICQRFKNNL